MKNDAYPILVGTGQVTDRATEPEAAREPLALMAEAAALAQADSGRDDLLSEVDSVRVVNLISWDYGNPPAGLARRLGIAARETVYTTLGGNSPQMLLNVTADELASGRTRIALLAGAEAMYAHRLARKSGTRLRWSREAGAPDRTIGDPRMGTQELENRHGASVPIQIYPMFENALRASRGQSLEAHARELGLFCARCSEIASGNPLSWFPEKRSAEEIMTPGPSNRMVGFPYPKLMNSVLDVSQGAAVLMTTDRTARELGIPEDRWIYLAGGADAADHWFVLDRVDYHSSPAIRLAARTALEQADVTAADLDFLDLYSCFPVAPRIARDMIGIPRDDLRDLTVTGSLLYFGGPGSNHALHAAATMAGRLRSKPGATGLVTGLGWYLTKHSVGVYSSRRPRTPWRRRDPADLQRELDSLAHPPVEASPTGRAVVETYTVMHGRDGAPERGVVIGRLADGGRFIANTPTDQALLESMTAREVVGTPGRVEPTGPDGTNVFRPD